MNCETGDSQDLADEEEAKTGMVPKPVFKYPLLELICNPGSIILADQEELISLFLREKTNPGDRTTMTDRILDKS